MFTTNYFVIFFCIWSAILNIGLGSLLMNYYTLSMVCSTVYTLGFTFNKKNDPSKILSTLYVLLCMRTRNNVCTLGPDTNQVWQSGNSHERFAHLVLANQVWQSGNSHERFPVAANTWDLKEFLLVIKFDLKLLKRWS